MVLLKLQDDDLFLLLRGWDNLSPPERRIIEYLDGLPDKTYKGTFVDLNATLNYGASYFSAINRACHSLEKARLIRMTEPIEWYSREIHLVPLWYQILIGNERKKEQ